LSKTYKVDFQSLEAKAGVSGKHLNRFERDVYSKLAYDPWENTTRQLDIQEALKNVLTKKQHKIITLVMQEYNQDDIAKMLCISQQAVSKILKSAYSRIEKSKLKDLV